MNCEMAQERIVLAAYGELTGTQVDELEQHLAICTECRREQDAVENLKGLAWSRTVEEPSANLVARARIRLDEALDALPPRSRMENLRQWIGKNWSGLRTVPVAAGLLLAAGVGGGTLGGYEVAIHAKTHESATAQKPVAIAQAKTETVSAANETGTATPESSQVASISEIVRTPNSREVEVRYNRLVTQSVKGSLDDPAIRKLLTMASTNAASPKARENSLVTLAEECRNGVGCQDPGARESLMTALRSSKNARLREKALEGLEPYVAEDVRVRNAVLEALLNDRDPRIRTISINLLGPVEADTSVRQVLYSVSTTDENPQIRNVSRQVLSRMPEVQ